MSFYEFVSEKEYLLARIGAAIIFVGVIFGVLTAIHIFDAGKDPIELGTMRLSDISEGVIAEGEITANYGVYKQETRKAPRVSLELPMGNFYYVIPFGEGRYIGVYAIGEELNKALEKQTAQTIAYIGGSRKEPPEPVHFKGKLERMDDSGETHFLLKLQEMGLTPAEAAQCAVKYCINDIGGKDLLLEVGLSAGGILGGTLLILIWVALRKRGMA